MHQRGRALSRQSPHTHIKEEEEVLFLSNNRLHTTLILMERRKLSGLLVFECAAMAWKELFLFDVGDRHQKGSALSRQ